MCHLQGILKKKNNPKCAPGFVYVSIVFYCYAKVWFLDFIISCETLNTSNLWGKIPFWGVRVRQHCWPSDGKKQWMKRNTLKEKQELQKANVSFQKHAVVPTAFIIKHFNIYNYFKLSSSRTIPGQIQRQPHIHAWLTLFKIVYGVKCV